VPTTRTPEPEGAGRELRSHAWFSGLNTFTFAHRSWNGRGYPPDVFDGRPVIGICNTWSELTPCNAHFRRIADHVKRGVYEAGGFPLEFPVFSTGESSLRPTAMLFRNLASMDVEESIRANPIDGVVLLVGCDKTTPALLMGAASCDLPAIAVSVPDDTISAMATTLISSKMKIEMSRAIPLSLRHLRVVNCAFIALQLASRDSDSCGGRVLSIVQGAVHLSSHPGAVPRQSR